MKIEELQSHLNDLYAKRDALNDEIIQLSDTIDKLIDDELKETYKNVNPPLSLLLEIYYKGRESRFLYEKQCKYFEQIPVVGISKTFWNTDYITKQRIPVICLLPRYTDLQLNQLSDFLEKVILPVIKTRPDNPDDPDNAEDCKYLGIYEHLDDDNAYKLAIYNNTYKIVKMDYGTPLGVYQTDSLLKALRYIRKRHCGL